MGGRLPVLQLAVNLVRNCKREAEGAFKTSVLVSVSSACSITFADDSFCRVLSTWPVRKRRRVTRNVREKENISTLGLQSPFLSVDMLLMAFDCSLLTLGTVIGTLSENVAKGKRCVRLLLLPFVRHISDARHFPSDHVPFRNSKLTRMLQPSLSGNARISVICTINPDISAIAESTSTLLFARRIKGVKVGIAIISLICRC